MKKNIFPLIAFLIISIGMVIQVKAQTVSQPRKGNAGSWRLLGTIQAKFSADHDAILVNGPYDFFRKVKFKVTDAPLSMVRMVVRYDDGGAPENIDTRFTIPQGGESRVIELKGGKRKLKSIEFWYDTQGVVNGRADVTLFGLK
jgi:hypothetical protein